MILRDYQQDCIDDILTYLMNENRALCVLATGTGKTEIAIGLIKKAQSLKPSLQTIILINNVELIEQTHKRYLKSGLNCSVFCGSLKSKEISQVTIASIQSIYNQEIDADLIITDETHAISENEESRYHKFLSTKKAKIVGFSATPFRSDGYIYGEGKFYKDICYEMSFLQAIEKGWIVKPVLKHTEHQFDTSKISIQMGEFNQKELEELTVDEKKTVEQIKDALPKLSDRKKTVWACTCIEHAELVYRKLNEHEEAAIVHSQRLDRDIQLEYYLNEPRLKHLVFVNIVKEGFDFAPIDSIVFLRPTRSPTLYIQIVGRGLRKHEDKKDCIVLDYGQVVQNCGSIVNPIIREKGQRRTQDQPTMKFCPKCLSYLPIAIQFCEYCGHTFQTDKEKTKNLTSTAASGDILELPVHTSNVLNIYFNMHKAKSGADCYRIDYYTLFQRYPISEYFVKGNDYAERKFTQRLIDLGATYEHLERLAMVTDECKYLTETFQHSLESIEFQLEGKFYRIRKTNRK